MKMMWYFLLEIERGEIELTGERIRTNGPRETKASHEA
jgi:hypothetical protein